MAFPLMTDDVENITLLDPEPNDVGGLSAHDLQVLFDKAGVDLKKFLNETLIPALEAGTAGASIGVSATGITATKLSSALAELKAAVDAATVGTLPNGSVTESIIATGAVTTAKIADAAVTEGKIYDGAVTNAKIAANAVESGNIKNGEVTTDKLAGTSVTAAKLSTDAVETGKIKTGAVTAAKTSFLPSSYYGDSLPGSGSEGQIFFLKV